MSAGPQVRVEVRANRVRDGEGRGRPSRTQSRASEGREVGGRAQDEVRGDGGIYDRWESGNALRQRALPD